MINLHPSSDNSEGVSCRIELCAGDTGHTVETGERDVACSSHFPVDSFIDLAASKEAVLHSG